MLSSLNFTFIRRSKNISKSLNIGRKKAIFVFKVTFHTVPMPPAPSVSGHLTAVCTILDRCALVCPAGQSVFAQVEEGHGFKIQITVRMGFRGHGHAIQEV